jgi:hypothetical protein
VLRSGDSILLRNKKTNGHLAADLGVRQANIDESYRLNTSKANEGPVTRNVFTVERYEQADIFGTDNVIRFGQKGVQGSPDGSARNDAFKARHAKNIAKGKMSAAYWANKVKW